MGLYKAGEGLRVSDGGLCGYLYTSSMSHGRGITLAMAVLSPLDSSTGPPPSLFLSPLLPYLPLSLFVFKTSQAPLFLIRGGPKRSHEIFSAPDVSK